MLGIYYRVIKLNCTRRKEVLKFYWYLRKWKCENYVKLDLGMGAATCNLIQLTFQALCVWKFSWYQMYFVECLREVDANVYNVLSTSAQVWKRNKFKKSGGLKLCHKIISKVMKMVCVLSECRLGTINFDKWPECHNRNLLEVFIEQEWMTPYWYYNLRSALVMVEKF